MVELFPLPNEGVLLPTRSATSRCLKTEYTDHQVRYKMRGCVAALVKDNGLYTGGNGDFGYFSYN